MFKKVGAWAGFIVGILSIIGGTYAGVTTVDSRYAKAPDLAAMKQMLDTQTLYFEQKFALQKKQDVEATVDRLQRKERSQGFISPEEVDLLRQKRFELDNVNREIESIQKQMDDLKMKKNG